MKHRICLILILIMTMTFVYAIDNSGANIPELYQGLYPIKYSEGGDVVFVSKDDDDWYDYSTGKWANAVTLDKQGQMNPSEATEANIIGYYVWIPRYAYIIRTGYNTSDTGRIDIRFLNGKENKDFEGNTYYTVKDFDNESNNWEELNKVTYVGDRQMEYLVHSAFTFEEELSGIWVGKYEASLSQRGDINRDGIVGQDDIDRIAQDIVDGILPDYDYDIDNDGELTNVDKIMAARSRGLANIVNVKPDGTKYVNIAQAFKFIRDMTSKSENYDKYNLYGLSEETNTHLIKATEYGAVVYLMNSIYGDNSLDNYYKVEGINSGKEYIAGYLEGIERLGQLEMLDEKYKDIYTKDEDENIVDVKGSAYLETSDGENAWEGQTIVGNTLTTESGLIIKENEYGSTASNGQEIDVGFRVVITKGSNKNEIKNAYQKDNSYYWLMKNGDVWVMGENEENQLGLNDINYKPIPIKLENDRTGNKLLPIRQIVCIEDKIYFIAEDGSKYLNGEIYIEELDLTQDTIASLPELQKEQLAEYEALGEIKSIYGNGESTIIETVNGKVYVVGDNINNKLGINAVANIEEPMLISITGIKDVGIGNDFGVFLKDDGSIVGYGNSSRNGNGLTGITQIAVQKEKAYFMKTNNQVIDNQGNIMTTNAYKISAGDNHLVVLKTDGTTETYGQNNSNLTNVIDIYAGKNMTVYLTSDGKTHLMTDNTLKTLTLPQIVYVELNGDKPYFLTYDRKLLYQDGTPVTVEGEELNKIREIKGDIVLTEKNGLYNFNKKTRYPRISSGERIIEDGMLGDELVDCKIYGNSAQEGTPTPDNPIEVESVGELTKNLLNCNATTPGGRSFIAQITGSILILNGTEESGNSGLEYSEKNSFILSPGRYTYSFHYISGDINSLSDSIWLGLREKDSNWLSGSTMSIRMNNYISGNKVTFNIAEEKRVSFGIVGRGNVDNLVLGIQLEKGDTATPYEPYGKYKIPVTVTGKNLFNSDTPYRAWVRDSGEVIVDNENGFTDYVKVDLSSYTISANTTMIAGGVVFYDENKQYLGRKTFSGKKVYSYEIADSDIKYMRVWINFGENFTKELAEYYEVQLEENKNASQYEPYVQTVTNIYLDEPLRKLGDYADYIDFEDQKVVRKIKEKIYDGSEKFIFNATTTTMAIDYYTISEDDLISNGITNEDSKVRVLSNWFKGCSALQRIAKLNYISVISTHRLMISVDKTVFPNSTTLNSWVKEKYDNGTPLIVYYELATPIEEPIELPSILTQEGYNVIEVDTAIKPSNIMVKYNYEGSIL